MSFNNKNNNNNGAYIAQFQKMIIALYKIQNIYTKNKSMKKKIY